MDCQTHYPAVYISYSSLEMFFECLYLVQYMRDKHQIWEFRKSWFPVSDLVGLLLFIP